MTPRVLVVAGEASGDKHAAGLLREAQALVPGLQISGVGGDHLRGLGAEIVHDARHLGVAGIAEVFEQLPALARALFDMRRRVREEAARRAAARLIYFHPFSRTRSCRTGLLAVLVETTCSRRPRPCAPR